MVSVTPYWMRASWWFGPPDRCPGDKHPMDLWIGRGGSMRWGVLGRGDLSRDPGRDETVHFRRGNEGIPRACPNAGEHWRRFTPHAVEPWVKPDGANQVNPIKSRCLTDNCSAGKTKVGRGACGIDGTIQAPPVY